MHESNAGSYHIGWIHISACQKSFRNQHMGQNQHSRSYELVHDKKLDRQRPAFQRTDCGMDEVLMAATFL